MKKIIIAIFTMSLAFHSTSLAGAGAVGAAETNMAQNIAGQAAAGTYVSTNSARCSSRNISACIRAAMGIAQIAQMIMQFGQAKDVRDDFGLDEFSGFDPNDMGFCLDPSTGCSQDALDTSVMDGPLGPALLSGDPDQLDQAMTELEKLNAQAQQDLEAKGYSIDTENGTVTSPDGSTQSLSGGLSLPSDLDSALKSRLAAIDKNITNGGTGAARGVASAGEGGGSGSGGGVEFKDEFIDGAGTNNALLKARKKREKTKEDLLAAMADKNQSGVVGMAGDDIFKMIQRRYEKKKKSSEFIVQQ